MSYPKEAQRKGGEAGRKHGIDAMIARGSESLPRKKRSRYAELRELAESNPGREEYRIELLAHLMMLLDLGWSELIKIADDGGNVYTSPVVARMGTFVNTTVRLLDSFPKAERDSVLEDVSRIQQDIKDAQEAK